MTGSEYNVLFLCTGNSARSVMAECAMNRWGKGRFRGFSAGSRPKGAVHSMTIELLKQQGFETSQLRSKSWDEFSAPDSPRINFVITVCDHAAAEQCPLWPGQPISGHWGVADPAAFEGTDDERRSCFARVYRELESRIRVFASLNLEGLDNAALCERLREIGEMKIFASMESEKGSR